MFTGLAGILTASHAGGHWFESSSLHQEKPRNHAGYEVFSVCQKTTQTPLFLV